MSSPRPRLVVRRPHAAPAAVEVERERHDLRDARRPRRRARRAARASRSLVELRAALGRVVEHRRIDGGDEDAAIVEADVAPHGGLQAAHEEAGEDEQHHRQRHLADDQAARSGSAAGAIGQRPPRRLAARWRPRVACSAGARPNATAVSAARRDGRPPSTVPSMREVEPHRQRERRPQLFERREHPLREREARAAASAARSSASTSSWRTSRPRLAPSDSAHRDFGAPIGRAGDEQAGDVGAGDEQHQPHRQRQHEQEAGDRADGVGRQAQRLLAGDGDAARPRRGRRSTPAG